MDEDDKELVRRVMAKATAMLEDAVEMAVAGQSPRLNPPQLADVGLLLQGAMRDIAILAEAAMIVANLDVSRRQNRRKRPR